MMRSYRYVARSGAIDRVEGVLQADTATGAARALLARGLFPVDVSELGGGGGLVDRLGPVAALLQRTGARSLDSQQLALFARRLGDLLDAGVPMQRAVEQLHRQTRQRRVRTVLADIARRVRGGESLSHALESQGEVFPRSLVGAVEAGETSGGLVPILQGLADLYEKEDDLRRTVRGAMLYPALVLVVSLATLLVMILYLLPRLSGLYVDLGQELPAPTRFLVAVSEVCRVGGPAIAAGLVAVGAGLAVLRARSARFRRVLAQALLRLPLVGRIVLGREVVRFAHTLASLVGGGVPLMRALWFAARSAGNPLIGEELRGFGRRVGEGASLSAVLAASRLGDDALVVMVQVGEEMGRLPDALAKACRVYERELRDRMKVVTTLLEPMLIVAIGLVVGFIVFSMMLPIMELDLA
jgi:general secretion pathway protein F